MTLKLSKIFKPKLFIIFCVILNLNFNIPSADIYDEISKVIRTGNSKELAKYFDKTLELTILDIEDTYSKSQAELIIKDFFAKNPPIKFSILHKGGTKELKFATGDLITEKSVYRLTFCLKNDNDKSFISKLIIITKEDE